MGNAIHIHMDRFRGSIMRMIFPSTTSCGTSNRKTLGFNLTATLVSSLRRKMTSRPLPLGGWLVVYEHLGTRKQPSRVNLESLTFKPLKVDRRHRGPEHSGLGARRCANGRVRQDSDKSPPCVKGIIAAIRDRSEERRV